MKIKTLTIVLLIFLFLISCSDNSKEFKKPLINKGNDYSVEFMELVQLYGQYSVVLAIINISMMQNENSEFENIVQDWDYADYKENILKTIDSSESFNQAMRNQVETLEKKGSLQDLVKCWLEIYSFLNHIRKLDLDISYEELLYGISEMKPIMDNFFHENNIQEWSSMSYSQMYQFDYYLCNFMIKIYGYERIKLLKAIINNSFVHVKKVE